MNSASTKNEIVQVPFHGDMLEALQTEDGKIVVHFKRVCESLGVDFSSQLKKMKERHWCEFSDITMQLEGAQARRLTMIDLESLPMWLATINPTIVRQDVKAKLIRYQCEAKSVLSAWFLGVSSDMPALAAELKEVKQRLMQIEQKFKSTQNSYSMSQIRVLKLKDEVKTTKREAQLVYKPFSDVETEHLSVVDYISRYGVRNKDGSELLSGHRKSMGKQVTALSRSLGKTYLLGTGVYELQVLNAWRVQRESRFLIERNAEADTQNLLFA